MLAYIDTSSRVVGSHPLMYISVPSGYATLMLFPSGRPSVFLYTDPQLFCAPRYRLVAMTSLLVLDTYDYLRGGVFDTSVLPVVSEILVLLEESICLGA